jgi:hypothetical protein
MLLSARVLKDVANVNSFEFASSVSWTEGDALYLYFQLVDAGLDTDKDPLGRRYMPPATSTLTVVLENIDDARKLTRTATQPFPEDASIWRVQILATDKIRGTPQMRLTLVEPGPKTTYGLMKDAIRIQSQSNVC